MGGSKLGVVRGGCDHKWVRSDMGVVRDGCDQMRVWSDVGVVRGGCGQVTDTTTYLEAASALVSRF